MRDSNDHLNAQQRFRLMASVKQCHTKPEMLLRRALHSMGYRYRVNDRRFPGSPDLVFPKHKAVIFVNGCFWHDHKGCKYATKPKSNKRFWAEKFEANRTRDARNRLLLKKLGWRSLTVWACELRHQKCAKTVSKVVIWLNTVK